MTTINSTITAALVALLLLLSASAGATLNNSKLPAIKALQVHNPHLLSSGLPMPAQFTQLAEAGVTVIINLIPTDNPNALNNEAELAHAAGLKYHQIDVDWQAPSAANYDAFAALMQQHQDSTILVHCQANFRASAFVYLYQLQQQGVDDLSILAPWGDLQQRYQQYPQWREFIDFIRTRTE
ncbi:protein tyrosine phosphatase family protein [uncultured Ferrimonas sp.]|uniref:protein tyrosine phosphatase family protein n=1 Tax=uncultured Ferrimonas sp. TaxID=432640 RepID=UPI0026104580|nr:protein tyrosine phosphatase family protein [uncultured Ferrimonas sp.]